MSEFDLEKPMDEASKELDRLIGEHHAFFEVKGGGVYAASRQDLERYGELLNQLEAAVRDYQEKVLTWSNSREV